jgi:hypothetical protein
VAGIRAGVPLLRVEQAVLVAVARGVVGERVEAGMELLVGVRQSVAVAVRQRVEHLVHVERALADAREGLAEVVDAFRARHDVVTAVEAVARLVRQVGLARHRRARVVVAVDAVSRTAVAVLAVVEERQVEYAAVGVLHAGAHGRAGDEARTVAQDGQDRLLEAAQEAGAHGLRQRVLLELREMELEARALPVAPREHAHVAGGAGDARHLERPRPRLEIADVSAHVRGGRIDARPVHAVRHDAVVRAADRELHGLARVVPVQREGRFGDAALLHLDLVRRRPRRNHAARELPQALVPLDALARRRVDVREAVGQRIPAVPDEAARFDVVVVAAGLLRDRLEQHLVGVRPQRDAVHADAVGLDGALHVVPERGLVLHAVAQQDDPVLAERAAVGQDLRARREQPVADRRVSVRLQHGETGLDVVTMSVRRAVERAVEQRVVVRLEVVPGEGHEADPVLGAGHVHEQAGRVDGGGDAGRRGRVLHAAGSVQGQHLIVDPLLVAHGVRHRLVQGWAEVHVQVVGVRVELLRRAHDEPVLALHVESRDDERLVGEHEVRADVDLEIVGLEAEHRGLAERSRAGHDRAHDQGARLVRRADVGHVVGVGPPHL